MGLFKLNCYNFFKKKDQKFHPDLSHKQLTLINLQ